MGLIAMEEMDAWCDSFTIEWGQASLTPWKGSLGRDNFVRPVQGSSTDGRPGAQCWRMPSFCRAEAHGTTSRLENWGTHGKDRCWILTEFPSTLSSRKLTALLPALPTLSTCRHLGGKLYMSFFQVPPPQAPKGGSGSRWSYCHSYLQFT